MNARPERNLMSRSMALLLLSLLWLPAAGCAAARMRPVLAEYAKIHASLANEETTGIAEAAAELRRLAAQRDPLPADVTTGAEQLGAATDVASAREAFKTLSAPMVEWARKEKPSGVAVLYCPVARASWLQTDEWPRNPYLGGEHRSCGEVVQRLEVPAATGYSAGPAAPASPYSGGGSHGHH